MSPAEERNKQVVRAFVEALERRDFTALEEHPGLYETRKYHPIWQKAFENLTYSIEEMIADGDLVATRKILRGKHIGPFMGAAPTGKNIEIGVLTMDRVVDGKIVEHWANADWVTVLLQLGIIPPLPTE